MTRLPQDDRNVIDRPDLPEYTLNEECAVPGCHYPREPGGGHHLWRRSFGTKSWWCELADGTVVGNRVGLCNGHHSLVTVNNARIIFKHGVFWWLYHGEVGNGHELDWQPPKYDAEHGRPYTGPTEQAYLESQAVMGDVVTDMHTGEVVQHLVPQPGETCEKCKRRVPHKAKASTPKSKVWSTRVPLEADTFSELVDAAAEHHGLTSRPYHRYLVLLFGVTLLLQTQKGELPA